MSGSCPPPPKNAPEYIELKLTSLYYEGDNKGLTYLTTATSFVPITHRLLFRLLFFLPALNFGVLLK